MQPYILYDSLGCFFTLLLNTTLVKTILKNCITEDYFLYGPSMKYEHNKPFATVPKLLFYLFFFLSNIPVAKANATPITIHTPGFTPSISISFILSFNLPPNHLFFFLFLVKI